MRREMSTLAALVQTALAEDPLIWAPKKIRIP
jgi:hypothetical protein